MYVLHTCVSVSSQIGESESQSVMSESLWPHGLYSPWNSPGQNTGVGSLSLLQGIFPTQGSNPGLLHCRQILYQLSHQGVCVQCAKLLQSRLTLCNPMNCSLPDSSFHGILQARIPGWASMPSSRGSFQPRDGTCVSWESCTAGDSLPLSHRGSPFKSSFRRSVVKIQVS